MNLVRVEIERPDPEHGPGIKIREVFHFDVPAQAIAFVDDVMALGASIRGFRQIPVYETADEAKAALRPDVKPT